MTMVTFQGTHFVNPNAMTEKGYQQYRRGLQLGVDNGYIRNFGQLDDCDVFYVDPRAAGFESDFNELIRKEMGIHQKAPLAGMYRTSPDRFSSLRAGKVLREMQAALSPFVLAIRNTLKVRDGRDQQLRELVWHGVFQDRQPLLAAYEADSKTIGRAITDTLQERDMIRALSDRPQALNDFWRFVRKEMPAVGLQWLWTNPVFQFEGEPSCYMGDPDSLAFKDRIRRTPIDFDQDVRFNIVTGHYDGQ